MILTVPVDTEFYPTLGPQVCDFMEQNLVFGPGDLLGEPLVLDEERRFFIWRMYEVYPKGHPRAGRRRFQRVGLSLPKGSAKTELAALIAACELHPEAPVRCDGWTKDGEPIGRPVVDPYVPMVSTNEEQTDLLAYGALRQMLEKSALRDDFDIGLERILRRNGDGMAESLSTSPSARDGARTTYQHFDETHHFVLPRLKLAHKTMMNNLPKRMAADAWALETTTAPEPGTGSVAESTMEYARAIAEGRSQSRSFFYFHRQASEHHDLKTDEGRRAAVMEAAGISARWRDIDSICALLDDPDADLPLWARLWCNQVVQGSSQAFNIPIWKTLVKPDYRPAPRALITLGFDGAMFHDSVALVATEVLTGFQWLTGLWECPPEKHGKTGDEGWTAPVTEVDRAVREMFATYDVWRMYCDPPWWQSYIAQWAGDLGREKVIDWWTGRRAQMVQAIKAYTTSINSKSLSHSGDKEFTRHMANARKDVIKGWRDEQGKPQYLICKEHPESLKKMDAAMAGTLSWTARTDAIATGAGKQPQYQMIFAGGARR